MIRLQPWQPFTVTGKYPMCLHEFSLNHVTRLRGRGLKRDRTDVPRQPGASTSTSTSDNAPSLDAYCLLSRYQWLSDGSPITFKFKTQHDGPRKAVSLDGDLRHLRHGHPVGDGLSNAQDGPSGASRHTRWTNDLVARHTFHV